MRVPGSSMPVLLCLLLFVIPVESRSKKCRKRKNPRKCERRSELRLGESTSMTLDEGPDDIVRVERKPNVDGAQQAPKWRKNRAPKDTLLIQREGSEAVFKCKAIDRPRPRVTWIKNGEPIRAKKNSKYHKSKWKLEVSKVTPGDNGNYTCHIENSAGNLEWTFTLRVLENQPISEINIVEKPENQTAHVGDTVVFMCRSNTWPAPSVHWFRKTNNKLVVEIVQMENNTLAEVLVVHNVSKADAGEYTCYIGNENANLQLTATLTVIEEGESLPFEPRCALHIRRQVLVDNTYGCQTMEPVEINYCMGSCGRSYFIPTMLTTDDTDMQANHLNQTCQCCVGVVRGIRIVPLSCPESDKPRRGFFTLLSDCKCQSCSLESNMLSRRSEDTVTLAP